MAEDNDIILEEGTPPPPELDIIDNQLILIGSLCDVDIPSYPDWHTDRNTVISIALKIIVKAQKNIQKSL